MSAQIPATDPEVPRSAARPLKRRRWRTVLLGLLIFVCGVVTGGGAVIYVTARMIRHSISHSEGSAQRVAAGLAKRYGLSPEQAGQVEVIVTRHNDAVLEPAARCLRRSKRRSGNSETRSRACAAKNAPRTGAERLTATWRCFRIP